MSLWRAQKGECLMLSFRKYFLFRRISRQKGVFQRAASPERLPGAAKQTRQILSRRESVFKQGKRRMNLRFGIFIEKRGGGFSHYIQCIAHAFQNLGLILLYHSKFPLHFQTEKCASIFSRNQGPSVVRSTKSLKKTRLSAWSRKAAQETIFLISAVTVWRTDPCRRRIRDRSRCREPFPTEFRRERRYPDRRPRDHKHNRTHRIHTCPFCLLLLRF